MHDPSPTFIPFLIIETPKSLSLNKEEHIQLAVEAHQANPISSLHSLALFYNVLWSILTDQANSIKTHHNAHAQELKVTAAQETILMEWIKETAQRGVPITLDTLCDHASAICGKHVGQS